MQHSFRKLHRILHLSRKALALLRREPRSFARAIYIRVPFLVTVRAVQVRAVQRVGELAGDFLGGSSGNAQAIAALEQHRATFAAPTDRPHLNESPDIDVSIVTYNSERWLTQFLKSLLSQRFPLDKMHIVFVDHGSTDDTVKILKRFREEIGLKFANFTIIEQENKGFGGGHDRAIRSTTSKWILVTNVDIKFNDDSISRVVEIAAADVDRVAAWELRQIPFEHPKHYDPVTLETNWQSHACILLRRDAYVRVGGYESRIFMYGEDVELSYRFRSYGYALRYVPAASIEHYSYADAEGLFKPLQYTGATLANVLIRLRYGCARDKIVGFILLLGLIFRWRQPFPGLRSVLIRNLGFALVNSIYFMRGRGPFNAHFPFRRFDFELRRDGAECKLSLVQPDERVTIITRTYDAPGREALLSDCGRSVANQTYRNIEWLVVQDGPGYVGRAVVERIAKQAPWINVRFIECEQIGRSGAGNVGLASATGTLCMFLDDDDLLYADHVEALCATLKENPVARAAYALSFEIHASQRGAERVSHMYTSPGVFSQPWNYEVLLDHNFIPIQSIIFERDLYIERGGFESQLNQLEDWNLWLRYGFGSEFVYLPKTTSLFHTPSEFNERLRRHRALHVAYTIAKEDALIKISKMYRKITFTQGMLNGIFPWFVRGLVDKQFYYENRPDVASAGIHPAEHPKFNTSWPISGHCGVPGAGRTVLNQS